MTKYKRDWDIFPFNLLFLFLRVEKAKEKEEQKDEEWGLWVFP